MSTFLCYGGHSTPLLNWFAAAARRGEADCCQGGESKGKKGARDGTAIAAAARNTVSLLQ